MRDEVARPDVLLFPEPPWTYVGDTVIDHLASRLGNRVDITVTAPSSDEPTAPIRVTIEAKLLNNSELMIALKSQLVDRYLAAINQRDGILLVYWVHPSQRPAGWPKGYVTEEELLLTLDEQAAAVAPQYRVQPFVLDISRPL
jgi:hypothetical protein